MNTKKTTAFFIFSVVLLLFAMWSFSVSAESDCEHVFSNYVYNDNATCVSDGTKTAHCDKCNIAVDTVTDEQHPKTGHKDDIILSAVEATCSQTGLTEGKKCSVCGTVTEEQKTVEKKAHTFSAEYYTVVESTCTSTGAEAPKCTVCGEFDTASQRPISMKEHSYQWTIVKNETCYSTGLNRGVCSVCKKTVTEVRPAIDHVLTEWTLTKAPTCSETGIESATCTVCSAHKERTVETIEHTPYLVAGYAATCEEKGLSDGYVCSVCHVTLVAQEKTPALGHDYYIVVETEPTCTSRGKGYEYCSNEPDYCKLTIIPASEHIDEDGDGFCDECEVTMKVQTCDCFCHHDTFIARFVRFIDTLLSKLFNKDFRCCEDMDPYVSSLSGTTETTVASSSLAA